MCRFCRLKRLAKYDGDLVKIGKRVENYRVERKQHDYSNQIARDREVLYDLLMECRKET